MTAAATEDLAARFQGMEVQREFAITDVWVKEGKEYKLAARYASRPDVAP